jgi:hypothetical protein
MAGSIATLSAALRWDLDDFDRGTRNIEGAFGRLRGLADGLSQAITKFGIRMSAAFTAPALAVAGFSIKAASDVKELQSAFDYTFGQISGRMNKWAKDTGDIMGRATQELQAGALAFGQLFNQAAPTAEAAARLSQRFAVLAQDASSFFNISPDEALANLRSGLVGEAEPLRKFGVFLSAAAIEAKGLELGLVKTGEELTEQGKIMARAAFIAEALSSATGDVERTSDSFANRVRALKGDLSELAVEIGEHLLPYAEKFVGWAREAVNWLRKLPEPVKAALAGFATFLAIIGPLSLALSGLVLLILPLFIARFGMIGQILIAVLNPIGSAIVLLLRFATSWAAISAVLGYVGPLLLRLLGPIGLVISLIWLFKDAFMEAFADIWREAVETIGPPLQKLLAGIGVIAKNLGAAFEAMANTASVQFLISVIEYIGQLIYWILRLGGAVVIAAITALIEALTGIAEYVAGMVEMTKKLLEGDWAGAWDAAAAVVGNAFARIAGWIKNTYPMLSALLTLMSKFLGTTDVLTGGAKSSMSAKEIEALWSDLPGPGGDFDGAEKDYALAGSGDKAKKGRGKTGPTAAELEARREEIRLVQALAVARDSGNLEAERDLQAQLDLFDKIERYERAGLDHLAAKTAAEKDLSELDLARAETIERELLTHERGIDLQLAELANDYRMIEILKDEDFLEKRILFYREKELSLVNATRLASRDLLDLERARAENIAQRAADQERERQLQLARIRGDNPDKIRAMDEQIRVSYRADELQADGLSEADAIAQATREGLDRSRAHLQGTFRDTFRDGLRAAMNGNLGDFFQNWIKDKSFNALSKVLDRLADSLANLIFGGQQGGGGGGGIFGAIGKAVGIGASIFGGGGGFSVGGLGAASVASLQSTFIAPGFASGGGGTIKGFPGVDQNILSLNGNNIARVSSGELLNIHKGEGGGSGGGVVEIRLKDDLLDARIMAGSARVVRAAAPDLVRSSVGETIRQTSRPGL